MNTLGRVIVDDVENDLEAGPVQRLHHVPELVERAERIGCGCIFPMGRKERHGRVAPVVPPTD